MISAFGYRLMPGKFCYSTIQMQSVISDPWMTFSDEDLKSLGMAMVILKIKKSSIPWHLEELEAATQEDLGRESDSDDENASDLERPAPL